VNERTPAVAATRSTSAPLIFLVVVAFVEVVLFLSALAMGVEGDDVVVLMLALITVLVGAGPILFNMAQPPERRQILVTLMTVTYVVYLVVPAFTQVLWFDGEARGTFHLAKFPARDVASAQAVALLGLAMLLLGFYLPFGRLAASVLPRPTRDWPPHAAVFVSLLTLGLAWLVYIPGQLGLIPSRAGSGALGTIASGSSFGIALLTLAWLRYRRPEAALLLAIVVPLTMLFNFFTGSKRLFLTPPLMFALAYIVVERRIRMSWLFAGFAALVALYPVSNLYRMVVNPTEGGRIASFMKNPDQYLGALSNLTEGADVGDWVSQGLESTGRRLDGLGVLTKIVMDTPERVPYQGGWTIGYIALSYIPRIIWPDKPGTTIGIWVSQNYGDPNDPYTHVGPSWMGEMFLNWGYPGVMFGMFFMGLLSRMLQERLFVWNGPIPALFGAVVVLYSVSRTVPGGLIAPVNGTVYNLAPILIAHYLVGVFTGYQRGTRRAAESAVRSDLTRAPAHPTR
jgi:hypothetical protein